METPAYHSERARPGFAPASSNHRRRILLLKVLGYIQMNQLTCWGTMKLGGLLLLFSGWIIVMAALLMLHGSAITGFVCAGFVIEIVGLILTGRAHLPHEDQG